MLLKQFCSKSNLSIVHPESSLWSAQICHSRGKGTRNVGRLESRGTISAHGNADYAS